MSVKTPWCIMNLPLAPEHMLMPLARGCSHIMSAMSGGGVSQKREGKPKDDDC